MSTRITVEQLERMKTHELAELLSNVVLVLKRLPNVEWHQLQELPGSEPAEDTHHVMKQAQARTSAPLTQKELSKKTVKELKEMATDLHVPFIASIKKADLIEKILAKHTHGHSEQYAIQDI